MSGAHHRAMMVILRHRSTHTQTNITAVEENSQTVEFWLFTSTTFICRIIPSLTVFTSLSPPSINPSLSPSLSPLPLLFFCVCVLRSGQAVWALIWKPSGFGQRLPSWLDFSLLLADCLIGGLVQLQNDSPAGWMTR